MRGAFTGAVADRQGRFEAAASGTIFLDEIGDMSLKTQAKVLRVLQEQVVERVGSTQSVRVDVRVVAATNKDLPGAIKAGQFREDLYFRLNVIPIFVPPLRARQADIPLLADHFMSGFAREYGRRAKVLSPEAVMELQRYPWPGNVRELRNVIERLMIMVPGETIGDADVAFLNRDVITPHVPAATSGDVLPLHDGARPVRAAVHPAGARGTAGQHVTDGRGARRRTQQPVPQDARLRSRPDAPR